MIPYAVVALVSAFLLFLVQPLIAKAILPWYGGAPAVWATCLLFFQTLLLVGYAYAHLSRPLLARRRVALHLTLLALSVLALPIVPDPSWKPLGAESPVPRILALLALTVGAPYLLLSATAPLLQDWFHQERPAGTPYRLYAWSNAGSLGALLVYPFVVERLLAVDAQGRAWSWAYVAFAILCGALALRVARKVPAARTTDFGAQDAPAPGRGTAAVWFVLSACASGLLLATTNQLTMDVAVVPFLWVLPLALYLLSFILAFAGLYRQTAWRLAFLVSLGLMAVAGKQGVTASLALQVAGALAALFSGCMLCNGELAARAPQGRWLTAFYLTMAAGGATGGLLVAVVAPLVFPDLWELPLFLLAPYFLLFALRWRAPGGLGSAAERRIAWLTSLAVAWLGIAAFVLPARDASTRVVGRTRNFYGVLTVRDDTGSGRLRMRKLEHGRVTHGTQFLEPGLRGVPTTYYAEGSGVDMAIRQHPRRAQGLPLSVGVVGLGAGTIATYGLPGDTVRFYEINPAVVTDAERDFTFLHDSRATVQTVVGDARLSLERETASPAGRDRFDVLAVDAFSSDAIPVHLLTRECAGVYWRALKPDGILAVHVSNRHLDLVPVVLGLARATGRAALRVSRTRSAEAFTSTWVLVAADPARLRALSVSPWAKAEAPTGRVITWTDGFSNLFDVLR